jgi:hypothetical protein
MAHQGDGARLAVRANCRPLPLPPPPPPPPPPFCRQQRWQPHRRQPAPVHSSGGDEAQPGPTSGLLQRASQLRAQQLRLDQEQAQLAAALEGLPPAQRQAVLEALGMQQRQQAEQLRDAAEADVAAPQPSAQPTGAPPDPEWLAALPPHLQAAAEEAGLSAVWRRQAEAVRHDQEWGSSEEFGGDCSEGLPLVPQVPLVLWHGSRGHQDAPAAMHRCCPAVSTTLVLMLTPATLAAS